MIPYNQVFSEGYELVATIGITTTASVTDLAARVDISPYTRLAIIVVKAAGQTLGLDFEQADALSGGTLKTIDAGSHDIDLASGDLTGIAEIRSEEFDTNPGIVSVESFRWFNVEATPGGSIGFTVLVFGLPKSQPAVNFWDVVGA